MKTEKIVLMGGLVLLSVSILSVAAHAEDLSFGAPQETGNISAVYQGEWNSVNQTDVADSANSDDSQQGISDSLDTTFPLSSVPGAQVRASEGFSLATLKPADGSPDTISELNDGIGDSNFTVRSSNDSIMTLTSGPASSPSTLYSLDSKTGDISFISYPVDGAQWQTLTKDNNPTQYETALQAMVDTAVNSLIAVQLGDPSGFLFYRNFSVSAVKALESFSSDVSVVINAGHLPVYETFVTAMNDREITVFATETHNYPMGWEPVSTIPLTLDRATGTISYYPEPYSKSAKVEVTLARNPAEYNRLFGEMIGTVQNAFQHTFKREAVEGTVEGEKITPSQKAFFEKVSAELQKY